MRKLCQAIIRLMSGNCWQKNITLNGARFAVNITMFFYCLLRINVAIGQTDLTITKNATRLGWVYSWQ